MSPKAMTVMKKPAAMKVKSKELTEKDCLTIDLKVVDKNTRNKHSGEVKVVKNDTMEELLMSHLMDEYEWEDDVEMEATLDVAVQCTTFVVDGVVVNPKKKIGNVCKNGSKVKMTTTKFDIHGVASMDVEAEPPAERKVEKEQQHKMMPPDEKASK